MSNDLALASESDVSKELEQAKLEMTTAGALTAMVQAKEIEAAIIVAKKLPRDIDHAEMQLEKLSSREKFAEVAEYCYPRGGQDVRGPTIKLMEAIAQQWGNIRFGATVLNRDSKAGESSMYAFAWDLESNTKMERHFTVPHSRDTRNGKVPLKDSRDIHEMEQNIGSRNLRACLERVIPRYLTDTVVEQCRKTLQSQGVSLPEKIKRCQSALTEKFGLNVEQIEKIAGAKTPDWTNSTIARMRGVINALNQGDTTITLLLADGVEIISTKQAKDLALLIGADTDKQAKLKDFGYDVDGINKIAKADYDKIKEAVQ